MAKRFIDTNLFRKVLIRGLEAPYKLLWIYIFLDCDHAGIWIKDFEIAKIYLNVDINEKDAIEFFNDKIIIIDNEKWFIPSFIEFQYGKLNPKNRAHNSVINLLLKYKNKGLKSTLQGLMDKDMDMDKDKEEDKEKNKEYNNKFNFKNSLIDLGIEKQIVDDWLKVRKTKKGINTETAFDNIKKEIEKSCLTANECIKKSVENSWSGFKADWLKKSDCIKIENYSLREKLKPKEIR